MLLFCESDAAVRIVGGASKKSIYSQKAIEAPGAKKKKPFWKF